MSLLTYISKQSRKPTGLFGRFVIFGQIFLLLFIIFFISGCIKDSAGPIKLNKSSKLPENVVFYITPKKEFYLPYQRVTLHLKVKNKGSFEKNFKIDEKDSSLIKLTPLSKSNFDYTYHVNWDLIHSNRHGHPGNINRVTWYLPNNWAGIIPQTNGNNTVQFNISTPVGYWDTGEFTINIHVPKEEIIPYNDLLNSGCYRFFEHEYSARMYNKNWNIYPLCPKDKLPYDKLKEFIEKYPYSAFTKPLLTKLKKTKRIVKSEHTKYDIKDMEQVEKILMLSK